MISGYLPLLICGTGTTGTTYKNYGSHASDYKQYDPFGGGFSTLQFTLETLFEEYEKLHNNWSRSNVDLELVRYLGAEFKLYRGTDVDFIFTYNRKPPFTDSQITGASLHPGVLMTKKRKRILPSFKTRPKGHTTTRVKIRPPTLFVDKWYFQKDLSTIPLLTVGATTASLRFPFCSPQTDNPCVYFLVLNKFYNTRMSIQATHLETNYTSLMDQLKNKFGTPKGTPITNEERLGTVFNTFKTQEHIKNPEYTQYKYKDTDTPFENSFYKKNNSLWGDLVYKKDIVDGMKTNAANMYQSRALSTYTGSQYLNFKTGMYSAIFLSDQRLSPDYPGLYMTVIYNPANDKGVGNKVWFDWCTKQDTTWKDTPARVPIVDVPLWAALNGYSDYCAKYFHHAGVVKEGRLTIISPYTQPPLTDKDNTDMGFIPYDFNFGNSKMPDGNSYIPIEYRFNWYPCMFHQQNLMNDIVQSGPFAYHGDVKSCTLVTKYKFKFLFGGNPIPQQTIKDPSKQPDWPIPGTGTLPRTVQIADPRLLHEGYYFRAWDLRRGLFGEKAIKRMSAESLTSDFITGPPKRSRFEVPAIASGDSPLQERKCPLWWQSEQETTSQESEEEQKTPKTIEQQLKLQLFEQKQIKWQLQYMFKQLVKTQHHLHVPIIH